MISLKTQKGFTLIEVITVIAILAVVSSIVAAIFFVVLRNSAKTGVNTSVAQSGNYILSVVSDLILNSTSVVLPEQDANGQAIINRLLCPAKSPIKLKEINLIGIDGGITNLACQDSSANNNNIASQSSLLIDVSQVSLRQNSCNIYCSQSDIFSPSRIDFEFSLTSVNSNLPENIAAPTSFRTSVSLRNYQQR